jgi:hypothetical protein
MSSDAMSHRNIMYEARHVALPVIWRTSWLVEVVHIIDSSAETHIANLQHISEEISSTLKQSPLAQREVVTFEANDTANSGRTTSNPSRKRTTQLQLLLGSHRILVLCLGRTIE